MAESISYKPIDDGAKTTGRPLGLNEAGLHYLAKTLNHALCNEIIILESNEPITLDQLRQAVLVTVQSQEMLRMKIVSGKDVKENPFGYIFVPKEDPEENIDLRSADPIRKEDWPILIRDIGKVPLDVENGQYWRFTFAPITNVDKDETCFQYVLILTIDHAIMDGVSVFDYLYRQLYPVLTAVVNDQDTTGILPYIPLTKSFEEALIKKETATPWYMKAAISILRWKGRTFGIPKPVELKYPDEPSRAENDDGSVPFAMPLLLNHDVTSALIKSSKQHGVTVHSVLIVASSMALYGAYKDAKIKPPSVIKQNWPIDMRVHAGLTSPQPLGTFNCEGESTVKGTADCTPEKFWSDCRKVFSGVKKATKLENCLESVKMYRYFAELMRDHSAEKLDKEFANDYHGQVSNLGNCNSGPEPTLYGGKCKIQMTEYYRAMTGMEFSKQDLLSHLIATFNGRLSWTVSFHTGMVSQKFIKTFLHRLEETICKFCKLS